MNNVIISMRDIDDTPTLYRICQRNSMNANLLSTKAYYTVRKGYIKSMVFS